MGMRRYLIVLDMDFLAADEELDLEPINYLVAEQERGPCEAVVLSLTNTSGSKMPGTEMLLSGGSGGNWLFSQAFFVPGKNGSSEPVGVFWATHWVVWLSGPPPASASMSPVPAAVTTVRTPSSSRTEPRSV